MLTAFHRLCRTWRARRAERAALARYTLESARGGAAPSTVAALFAATAIRIRTEKGL